jgi:hypothetical protein
MIVCMSRRICVDLYCELIALRPEWHDEEDDKGAIKVVMTGSAADPADWQPHIRNKLRREALANRFRDAADAFRVVIVRDMWLTGFDAPSLHTMYVDKPMRGHGLMQAIARVNRVFKGQAGRAGRRLPRPCRRAETGARDLYGERRHRSDRDRSIRGGRGHARKIRDLPRVIPRFRPWPVDARDGAATHLDDPRGAGIHSRAGTGERKIPASREGVVGSVCAGGAA